MKQKEFLQPYIAGNDRSIRRLMKQQITAPSHSMEGGMPDPHGIVTALRTAHFIQYAAAAFVSPDSEYYQHAKISESMVSAAQCLLRLQHPDGSIDLPYVNFHSPPDTAFVVEPLASSLTLLRRYDSEVKEALPAALQELLLRAGKALLTGGVHTSNHRWAVCMALARLYALFPDDRYRRRARQWLAEGIDIDADGQYGERSVLVYSPLINRWLITVARLFDLPEYYEPVRRNLEMTRYLLRPNGELITGISLRHDRHQRGFAGDYYHPYAYMARLDKNACFAAMVRRIEATAPVAFRQKQLAYFLEEPIFEKPLPNSGTLPTDYVRTFSQSGLIRIRRKEVDAGILAGNASFFTFQKKEAVLRSVRLVSAFFGECQFISENIAEKHGVYELVQLLEGHYYQPFPEGKAPTGESSWKANLKIREKSGRQTLHTTVRIREEQAGFALHFDIDGTAGVPFVIALCFGREGELDGVEPAEDNPGAFFLKKGYGQYTRQNASFRFGPGRHAHRWTKLGSALPEPGGRQVYLTGITPFRYALMIG